MAKRNWKRLQASNLRHAMELCLEHAKDKHNRSLEQVSELMGMKSKWTLYKWVESCDMPTNMIKPFEHACGIDFVSRWGVTSNGKLVIDIPKGRKGQVDDIQELQAVTHEMIGELIKFYAEQNNLDGTLAAIQTTLERIAWHKGNVEKYHQPELFDEDQP